MAEGSHVLPKEQAYYIDFEGNVVYVPEGKMVVLNDVYEDNQLPKTEEQQREELRQRMLGNA